MVQWVNLFQIEDVSTVEAAFMSVLLTATTAEWNGIPVSLQVFH
jgi:hypothetical protein